MPQEEGLRKGYASRTKLAHIMKEGHKRVTKKIIKKRTETARLSKARWVYVFDSNKELVKEIKGVSITAKKLKLDSQAIHNALKHKTYLGGYYFSYNQFFDEPF